MNPSSKIFVAGGTGMVGSAIIRKLLSSGYTIIVSNYHSRPHENLGFQDSQVGWSKLDLTRQADTEAFFEAEKPEYVFLAAAKVGGILANDTYKADFIYDNIAIATNVISCSHKYGVTKLLNLGSSCIYPRLAPQPLKEEYLLTGPLEPTNEPYAVAKIAAIKLCRYFNEQYGTNFISAMPTNLYGPNDNFNLETAHVLPALMRKFHLARFLREKVYDEIAMDIKRYSLGFGMDSKIDVTQSRSVIETLGALGITAASVTLWGTGEPYREFLHVDDLASAMLFLMDGYDWRDVGEFVNIGTGQDMRLSDIANVVKKIVGFSGQISYDTSKPDGMPRKMLDVSSMSRLGWRPSFGLEEGIRTTYHWYRKANLPIRNLR